MYPMHPAIPTDTFLIESKGETNMSFLQLTWEAKYEAGPEPMDLPRM